MSRVLSMILPCNLFPPEEVQEAFVGVIIVITSIIEETKERVKTPVCWGASGCVVPKVPFSN